MSFDARELAALLGKLAEALEAGKASTLAIGLAPGCDCGCGRPAGIAITVDGSRAVVADA